MNATTNEYLKWLLLHKIVREGRGFTVAELKAAGLSLKTAQSFGIATDKRRRNLSEEAFKAVRTTSHPWIHRRCVPFVTPWTYYGDVVYNRTLSVYNNTSPS
jgi:ribosomal protein L13E